MSINRELLSNLGYQESELPATKCFFDKLESAGIDPDQISTRTLHFAARIAVREEVGHGLLDEHEAADVYLRVTGPVAPAL